MIFGMEPHGLRASREGLPGAHAVVTQEGQASAGQYLPVAGTGRGWEFSRRVVVWGDGGVRGGDGRRQVEGQLPQRSKPQNTVPLEM